MLGEKAHLKGSVIAEDVMVRGRLIGSVRAHKVMLQSTAHVEGNLVHKSLADTARILRASRVPKGTR